VVFRVDAMESLFVFVFARTIAAICFGATFAAKNTGATAMPDNLHKKPANPPPAK
jgi:hypothetical protein